MYDMNQYAKDKLYRAEKLHKAQQLQLAEAVRENHTPMSSSAFLTGRKLTITVSLVTFFVLFLLLVPQTIYADDKLDPGGADAFYDQMIAYRLGHYYYVTGEYERAVYYYDQAIAGIPELILAQISSFLDLYWYKGDAQLKAGLPDAALESYQYYLQLAGDQAKGAEINFVQTLEANIATGNLVMEPLEA